MYKDWWTKVNDPNTSEDEKNNIEKKANCFVQFEDIANAFIKGDCADFSESDCRGPRCQWNNNIRRYLQAGEEQPSKGECESSAYENRDVAKAELINKPLGTWLVRKSSIQDNPEEKVHAFVISYKKGVNTVGHFPLVHRAGKGIYLVTAGRNTKAEEAFVASKVYPTVLSFLKGIHVPIGLSALIVDDDMKVSCDLKGWWIPRQRK